MAQPYPINLTDALNNLMPDVPEPWEREQLETPARESAVNSKKRALTSVFTNLNTLELAILHRALMDYIEELDAYEWSDEWMDEEVAKNTADNLFVVIDQSIRGLTISIRGDNGE